MTRLRRARTILLATAFGLLGAVHAAHAQGSITFVSPHAGEQVNWNSLYWIRWTASGIPAGSTVTVYYVVGEERVGACGTTPASSRACEWGSLRSPQQGMTLFIEARNAAGVPVLTVESEPFDVIEPGFPSTFVDADVGDVGCSGGGSAVNEHFTVRGAGADIWGRVDAFHHVWTELQSQQSLDATIRITAVNGTEPWTKVGVMVRESLRPDAAHHFIFASRDHGIAYQRRLQQGGTTLHTSLGDLPLPVTVQVIARMNQVAMNIVRDDGTVQRVAEFPAGPAILGLAVTSHNPSLIASGEFDVLLEEGTLPTVSVLSPATGEVVEAGTPYTIRWEQSSDVETATVFYSTDGTATWHVVPGCEGITGTACTWSNPGPPSENPVIRVRVENAEGAIADGWAEGFSIRTLSGGMLPAGWSNHDIGPVSASGSARFDSGSGTWIIDGSGADVWGTRDEFHFASTVITGDFEFTARVTAVEDLHRWVKAGLMAREGLTSGARHGFAFATPRNERGVVFQRRPFEGGTSVSTTGAFVSPPVWLKLVRRGSALLAYAQRTPGTDGWLLIDTQTYSNLAPSLNVGFAVSSHIDGTVATARFDNVSLVPLIPWTSADIGAVGLRGSTGVDPVQIEMLASGADIWGTADAFRYRYHTLDGDGSITVKVDSLANVNPWSKAGVMIRETTAPDSQHVMALVSASKGVALQYRRLTGGISAQAAGAAGSAPRWLRLTRTGDRFNAEMSSDGINWSPLGSVVVPMTRSALIGLALTSHDNSTRTNARFVNLSVQQ